MAYKLGLVGPDRAPMMMPAFRPKAAFHQVPDEVSYEYLFPDDQEDQGAFGACVSFAVAGVYEAALKKHHGITARISRRALYVMSQFAFQKQWIGSDSGLYGADALRTLETLGHVPFEAWPYDVAAPEFFNAVPSSLVQADHKLLSFRRVTGSEDPSVMRFEKIHVALAETGPLVWGQTWPSDWFTCSADRKLTATPRQGIAGGHEVKIVSSSRSRRFATLRCAWPSWGDRGYARVPWDVLAEFAPDDVSALVVP